MDLARCSGRHFAFDDDAGLATCHASTLVVLPDGELVAACFAGSGEGRPDTAIWLARRRGAAWEPPVKVADVGPVPHWNPVLFAAPDGAVHLFFKVGRRISSWRTLRMVSADGGLTWTVPRELVPGDRGGRGPVKNKPIVTTDGTWLAPASREGPRWDCFVDATSDGGRTWTASALVPLDHRTFPGRGIIQPALWESAPGRVHMLTRSTGGRVMRSDSADGGRTWSPAAPTALPNGNSGLDLTRLEDGTLVLAHNPVGIDWGPRTPLVVSTSTDNGVSWARHAVLEDEGGGGREAIAAGADTGVAVDSRAEFSYPAVVSRGCGVAVSYTWKRRRIAVVELDRLAG